MFTRAVSIFSLLGSAPFSTFSMINCLSGACSPAMVAGVGLLATIATMSWKVRWWARVISRSVTILSPST